MKDNHNFVAISGSLRKELKVKTPFQAIEKWFKIKPEIFSQKPDEFKNKVFIFKILIKQVVINNLVKPKTFQYIIDE